MIVVDMVKVNGKPLNCFRDAGVPGRIIHCTVKIIHTRRIRLCFSLLPKDRSIEENIGNVSKLVVLDRNLVVVIHNSDNHWFGDFICRIINASTTGNDPDQVLMAEIFACETKLVSSMETLEATHTH